jgi:signal transduction histidine kinase
LANIRLGQHAQTLEQLAVSRERNRIARELHDTMAHTLSGNAVNLEALKLMLPEDNEEIQGMLNQSLENTRAGLAETRRALKALRSKQVDDLGLSLAMRNLAIDAASRGDFNLSVDISDQLPEITPDVEQCVFRITQEALENIVRHASAQRVELVLSNENGALNLTITDDGCGFDTEDVAQSDQLGIQGMQERATILNGEFTILSSRNQGTTIRLSVPLYSDDD